MGVSEIKGAYYVLMQDKRSPQLQAPENWIDRAQFMETAKLLLR